MTERRGLQRTQVALNLTCRMPASPRPVTVHDVSPTGCRIELRGTRIEVGTTALFEPAGSPSIAGRVVWNAGNFAGVQFERPLGRTAAVAFGLIQPEPVVTDFVAPAQAHDVFRRRVKRLRG